MFFINVFTVYKNPFLSIFSFFLNNLRLLASFYSKIFIISLVLLSNFSVVITSVFFISSSLRFFSYLCNFYYFFSSVTICFFYFFKSLTSISKRDMDFSFNRFTEEESSSIMVYLSYSE